MNILHVGKYFPPHRGGMETFIRDLMVEQNSDGIHAAAIVHASERTLKTRRDNYRHNGIDLPVTRVARWATLAFAPISPGFLWQLHRAIKREQPDVLHLHMPNVSAFWCLLLPAARRIPWVIQWQSDVIASNHKLSLRVLYSIYRIPERWLLKRTARIIASSPPYLESSIPLTEFRDKCRAIPLGILEQESAPSTQSKSITPAVRIDTALMSPILRVLTVCRLTYYKGLPNLIKALSITNNIHLTLIGDGEERSAILQLARTLGVSERITHITRCSDAELAAHYRQHDVFCLPSIERTEAFGVVLLEAMRAGLPCLVTNVEGSGMRWVVDAPKCGFEVPHSDAQALAEMLNSLKADRDKLRQVGARGQQRYQHVLSLRRCCNRILTVYEEALSSAPSVE